LLVRLDARPDTLLDCARTLAEHATDRTALTLIAPDETHTITYRQFFERAARYAHALEQAGVRRDDLVVLVLQHSEEVLFGFWCALLLGSVPSIFLFLTPKLSADHYYAS